MADISLSAWGLAVCHLSSLPACFSSPATPAPASAPAHIALISFQAVVKDGRKTNELFVLDTEMDMRWRRQATFGEAPCPRDGAALALEDGESPRLWVACGRKANGRRCSDLYCLDLHTWTW